jgi:type VI secretion system protein ImpC
MDDFHPEQLYANLDLFGELSGLRQRLESSATFAKAAREVRSWAVPASAGSAVPAAPSRGSAIPADCKLADFAALVGRPSAPAASGTTVSELLRQAVAPCIVPAKDPDQDGLVAAVDEALSSSMRALLHHPDFQAIEALWRSVDFLVRRVETDESLQIILYDISAEELAADVSAGDNLESSALYRLLVEDPASDVNQGPLAAVIGLYGFERTPPHAELLGRIARIVARAPAPFISSISSDCLAEDPKDLHPLIKQSWAALRALPEAAYLGLVCPRFLLRLPYGEKTEPLEAFAFEEFTDKTGLRGMLWGNGAAIAALLLARSFTSEGAGMKPGNILSVDEMPFHYYVDKDGDQIALPCTERFVTSRLSSLLSMQGFIPLVCMKGAPEIRLGGFGSLGKGDIAGPWAPVNLPPPAPAPAPAPPQPVAEPAPPEPVAKPAPPEPVATSAPVTPAAVPETAREEPPAPADAPVTETKPATVEAPPPAAIDTELDSLLSDIAGKKEEKQEQAQEAEMDPDLKALLDEL